jgi:parallel beta-helix repeat protein
MLAYNIKQVKAEWTGTVYIRANGSIDPPDAPITSYDNITYTLIDNITGSNDGIVVERNNIILNGNGYTIKAYGFHQGHGIDLTYRTNVTINNIKITGFFFGVYLSSSSRNVVSRNSIESCLSGIGLYSSSSNEISGNNITANNDGIFLFESEYNYIFENNIENNENGIECSNYATRNRIYHNNFKDNIGQVGIIMQMNFWDDGYPSGGNYWSDYAGVDANNDGIGDTPYVIDESNQDSYPLVAPISVFNLGVWNSAQCKIDVISNSIISDVQTSTLQKTISFNVSGIEGTAGFCRVAIPNNIVQNLWQGNYMVLLNGEPWPFNNWTDTKNTYIYINYTHSEHKIVIIPEFPSTMISPLFMLTTLITTVLLKKKRKIERKLP